MFWKTEEPMKHEISLQSLNFIIPSTLSLQILLDEQSALDLRPNKQSGSLYSKVYG